MHYFNNKFWEKYHFYNLTFNNCKSKKYSSLDSFYYDELINDKKSYNIFLKVQIC